MPSGGKKSNIRGQEQPEMIGQKFGRLLVLNYNKEVSKQSDYYLCKCDCGQGKIVKGKNLRNKGTRSCGCLQREMQSKWMSKLNKQLNKFRVSENHPGYYHGLDAGRAKFRKTVHAYNVCQYDDGSECKGRLEAHHLDGNHDNNTLKNGALLCHKHHDIVTRGGNVWRPNHAK